MYLKRLEIKGFKSFAEKTVLDFLSYKNNRHSITAIVGPNGAGKSNIADAIRWVMGEQSLKNLRGKKSEDVIFGGSETKGQLGAAEVAMVLDNSDLPAMPAAKQWQAGDRLMSDYSEITIARRLYRSGEGEYLINNNPVRLLDVYLLLAKAQFAQHSYSVVGQGMIDRLLTVGPAERKDFLDEASGIKEFQIKQHQAELKLARTEENIAQAERLAQEVEPRLKILARQVKKLEKRQEVEMKLRENQEKYYASIYLANKIELDELNKNLSEAESRYRGAFKELESAQTELAALARASTRQEAFNELQSKYQSLLKQKNEWERQLAIKDGQMHAEYNKAGKQNISWIENKTAELKLRHGTLLSQLRLAQTETDSASRLILEQKDLITQITKKRTEQQTKISQLEKEAMQGQSQQHYWQFSGLAAVQSILEHKNKFGQIYGLLAELGEAEEKYKLALEAAAGLYLSAVVVENEEAARLAIEFLRDNRLGVATFLPLNKLTVRNTSEELGQWLSQPGVLGLASDFIKYEAKFALVFSFVFGQTLVVENLSIARRIGIGKARLVTLAGDSVEETGVMRGGYRQAQAGFGLARKLFWGKENFLECQSQIDLERQNFLELETHLENLKAQILELESKKEAAGTKADMLAAEVKNITREIAGLEQELLLCNAGPEEYGSRLSQLLAEKNAIVNKMPVLDEGMAELAKKIDNFNKREEDEKQRIFSLQKEMQKKQNVLNEILSSRNDLKIQIAKLETKQTAIADEVRAEMNMAIDSVIERRPPLVETENISETTNDVQKLKYQLSLIGGIDEEVVNDYQQTKERFDFLSSQINDLKAATRDLEKMILELDELMKRKRDLAFKKIRKEFDRYVKVLFGGGSADMYEVYGEASNNEESAASDNALEEDSEGALPSVKRRKKILTGIDIKINPPGKRIKYINTLSGGERTLASIALICAVLNYNPAPFVILDEVEAALDETNSRRFAQIILELSSKSQFIIITHNRVTMHSADALYGVVMNADGISKLLSVNMEEADSKL